MTVAIIMIAILAAVLVAAIAPALVLDLQTNQTSTRFASEYDRMIAEFARRRSAEGSTGATVETSREDTRRALASGSRLQQRHS